MSTSSSTPTKQVRVLHHPNHTQKRTAHTFFSTIQSQPPLKNQPPPQLDEQQLQELEQANAQKKLSMATQLLLDGHFQRSIQAFEIAQKAHPETKATCQAQIGAANFFLQRYEEAIQHYLQAQRLGANQDMMQANIQEALDAIRLANTNT